MPKNNKNAPLRTVLFVLLACILFFYGVRGRVPTLRGAGLSGFVKEVVSWMDVSP